MTRAALEALIARLETKPPSIELFIDVMKALGAGRDLEWQDRFYDLVGLNAWLDAAVELAERVLPGHSISIDSVIDSRGERRSGAMAWRSGAYGRTHHAVASAPAPALMLAVCRAKLAEMPE